MKKHCNRLFLFLCFNLACIHTSILKAQDVGRLDVGDAAPKISYSKWIKGTPINSMDDGQLYVLEFWATWCGPCKAAMPHLTELSKKYANRVRFVGVNIWEKTDEKPYESCLPEVTRFVNSMGDKMGYDVIVDNNAQTMVNTWMKPAGQDGIPATFLIKSNRIIWIGHPIRLDSIIESVFNGTYDMEKAKNKIREQSARSRETSARYKRLMEPITDALAIGDYQRAFAAMDSAVAAEPILKLGIDFLRFQTLLKINEDSAVTFLKKTVKESPDAGPTFASEIIKKDSLSMSTYEFALQQFMGLSKKEGVVIPLVYEFIATAYYKMGNRAEAINYQEKAIVEARKALKEGKWEGTILDYTVTDYENTLKKYKEAAQK